MCKKWALHATESLGSTRHEQKKSAIIPCGQVDECGEGGGGQTSRGEQRILENSRNNALVHLNL